MPQGMQGSHFGTPAAAICKQGLFLLPWQLAESHMTE
jgi:hypothetical protein